MSSAKVNSYYANDGSRSLIVTLNYLPAVLPQPKHIKALFFHLSNLQLVFILLSIQMRILLPTIHQATYPYYIGQVAEILTLQNYFENHYQAWIYGLAVTAVWVYLVILAILFVLLGVRAITRKQYLKTPNVALDIIFQFHFNIMFWIANIILLVPWADQIQDQESVLGLNSDHKGFMLLNWTAFILNYFFGIILALFAKEPFKGKEEYAAHSSSHQFILFLSKAVIAPFTVFLQTDKVGIAGFIVIASLALSLFMAFTLIKSVPFYFPSTMKSSLVWNHIAIWIAFVNTLVVCFWRNIAPYNITGLAYLETIFVPLFIKLALTSFGYIIRKYISKSSHDLQSEKQVFAKLMCFQEMTKNMKLALNNEIDSNIYEAYFMGDVSEHSAGCENHSCVCHVLLKEEFPHDLEEMRNLKHGIEIYLEDRILEIASQSIERLRDCNNLRVILANLILESQNVRLSVALNYLYSITQDMSNVSVNIKRNILLRKIQESLNKHFNNSAKDVLDIKSYLDFQTDKATFTDLLMLITKKYQEFWNCYRQSNFSIKELYERSIDIESKSDTLDRLWNKYVNKYPRFYHALGDVYCSYQKFVRNCPSIALKTAKKYSWKLAALVNSESKKHSTEISEHNIYLDDTVTFYVSMSREKTGRIQFVSSSASRVLGYTNEELVGKNINVLMSPLIAKNHEQLLNRHRELSKMLNSKNHYNITAYVRGKRGFYAPCTTYVTIFPYIQKELTYIGVLRTHNFGYEHILVTETGQIDGFTQRIAEELNLPVDKPIYLSEICPDMVKAPMTPGSKHKKFAKVVLDAMSEDFIEKGARSSFRRASEKQISRTLRDQQLYGHHGEYEEVKWKQVNFIQYGTLDPYGVNTEKFAYDTRVVQQTFIQKTFHVIYLKSISQDRDHQKTQLELALTAKKNSSEQVKQSEYPTDTPTSSPRNDDVDEADSNSDRIPPERSRVFDERMVSLGILYSPANRSEAALLSAKQSTSPNINFMKTTIGDKLPTDVLLSPKGQQGQELNFSNYIQLESDLRESVPARREGDSAKRKTVTIKDFAVTQSVEVEEKSKDSWRQKQTPFNRNIKYSEPKAPKLKLSGKASSSLTSATSRPKIEEAVYMIPPSSVSKRIGFLTILAFIICTALFVVYTIHRIDTLTLIQSNVQILDLSSSRLNQIVLSLRSSQTVYYLESGLLDNNALKSLIGATYSQVMPSVLLGLFNNLVTINNDVRTAINTTETSTQNKIYANKVPMVSMTDSQTYYANIFDAVTQISVDGLKVSKTPAAMVPNSPFNEHLYSVLFNSGGVVLVYSEEINNVLVQDTQYKTDFDKRMLTVFLVVVIILAIINIGLLGFKQLDFIKDRDKFIELLLHLDERQIDIEMEKVAVFETSLYSQESKHELEKRKPSYHSTRNETSRKKESAKTTRLRKRDANYRRINVNQWVVFTLAILLFIIFVIPFVHLLIRISVKNVQIVEKINNLIEVNTTLYELLLMFVAFNEYLVLGGSGFFRDSTVDVEWERLYTTRANSQDFFLKLLINMQNDQSCDEQTLATLTQLISGNLCQVFPKAFPAICATTCDGAVERGVQAINTYMISGLRSMKAEYDNSAKTNTEIQSILAGKMFTEIQIVVSQWQYPAFLQITQTLEKCTLEMLQGIREYTIMLATIYIPIWVICAFIVSRYFMKHYEKERVEWRKMFRKIPFDIIVGSKILKFHLAKHSELVIKT